MNVFINIVAGSVRPVNRLHGHLSVFLAGKDAPGVVSAVEVAQGYDLGQARLRVRPHFGSDGAMHVLSGLLTVLFWAAVVLVIV
jgi:hypothetical protein